MSRSTAMTAGAMKKLLVDVPDDVPMRLYSGDCVPHDIALVGIGYQVGNCGQLYDHAEPTAVPEPMTTRYRKVLLLCDRG